MDDYITMKYDVLVKKIADICKGITFQQRTEMETAFHYCKLITEYLKRNNKYCPELGDKISYVCADGKITCLLHKRPFMDLVKIDLVVSDNET